MYKRVAVAQIECLLSSILKYIMGIFFMIIFFIVFVLVLLRYGFGRSIFGGAELVTLLFIYSTAFGSALLFRERKHIRILYFLGKLPPTLKKIAIVTAYILNIIFHISLFYFALSWIAVTGHHRTAILRVPHWLMQISIPIYASIVILYVIRNIILVIVDNKYLESETQDYDVEL